LQIALSGRTLAGGLKASTLKSIHDLVAHLA
jgi:hypothetical protein